MPLSKRAKDTLAACLEKEKEFKASEKLLNDIKAAHKKCEAGWYEKVQELIRELKSCIGEHHYFYIEVNGKIYHIYPNATKLNNESLPLIINEIGITR